jgi:hypothetical protein
MNAMAGSDVDAWAGWMSHLEGPLKAAVHSVMQERFGNAFVGMIDQKIAANQLELERPLTQDEITNISMTYGKSIDYAKVRIHFGGAMTAPGDGYARTIGNTIYFPTSKRDDKDGALYPSGMELLYHEIGHVWQFQHAGAAYLPEALIAQLLEGGDGEKAGDQGAYQWRDYARAGRPLGNWNREAQAEMGARYNICLHEIRDAVAGHRAPLQSYMDDFLLAFPYALQLAQGQGAVRHDKPIDTAQRILINPLAPEIEDILGEIL